MLITFFLQGVSLGLVAAASPGPFQAYVISESLAGGWRRGAPVAFAPLITDVPIVLLMLLVLRQLPPQVIRGLFVAGGLFVLYLAWGLLKQWRAGPLPEAAAPPSGGLRKGVVMNFLSPGPYTFWALVNGPLLLTALGQSVWHGTAFLVGFYGLLIGGMLALAGVFDQARRLGPRVAHWLLLASIVILVGFAGYLVWQGISG